MSAGRFDNDYYFVHEVPHDERLPYLTPDEDTSRKPYTSKRLPMHTKPLIFHNGSLDYQKANRITPYDPPPEILFSGSDVVVKDKLRDKLLPLGIPNLAIQPAIYIDHKNNWHEDYWYLTFTELFDCWDRERSYYDPDPVDFDDVKLYEVYTYSLDETVLEETPLESRRLFKMGSTTEGPVVVHVSIASWFGLSGAVLVPIAEYGVSFP